MTMQAQPLTEEARPTDSCPEDCPNKLNGYCTDHQKMERSRIVGVAFFKFAGWSVPIGIMVLIAILTVLSQRVDTVEGKIEEHITGSNEKLDQIHHSVMTMEFNLRHDMKERGMEYTELQYNEETYE